MACCCPWCAACQMIRHEGLGGGYQLCHPEGGSGGKVAPDV